MFTTDFFFPFFTHFRLKTPKHSRTHDKLSYKLTSISNAFIRTPFPTNPSAEVADGILESCAVTAERYWADSI